MSEEQILTSEEKLNKLIADGNSVLTKLKKTLNVIWMVGGGTVIVFFMSFVDIRSRMATLEENKLPKTEAESTYAKKTDVVFLQNNIYDMNKSSFIYNLNTDEFRMELSYTRALKQFLGDVSRGVPNQQ
ncbi:MAG: hypothetical protein WC069_06730 [Candidatus Shapirobacteria bacterium]